MLISMWITVDRCQPAAGLSRKIRNYYAGLINGGFAGSAKGFMGHKPRGGAGFW